MIRIAHLSDTHFTEARLEDLQRVLKVFVDEVEEREVNLVVHAGDFFDKRSTPRERDALADFLQEITDTGIPFFGVKGNHDAAGELVLFNRLAVDAPTQIVDRPTAAPGTAVMMGGRGNIGVLALPWFDKAHLVAELGADVDIERTRLATIEAATNLLVGFRAEATRLRKQGIVPILVGHVMVAGSEMSSGQTLIGTTVELSPQDLLDVGAAAVCLGHVHKAQEWFGGKVGYSGSPIRHNFGEPEAKGFRLITLDDDGRFVSAEFIELPARQIVLIENDWTAVNTFDWALAENLPGALVRFRYRIRPQDLALVDEDVIRELLLAAGAAEVKVEAIVEHESRVRSEAVVQAQTLTEKVDAYFVASGTTVAPAQRERLHAKLAMLEGNA